MSHEQGEAPGLPSADGSGTHRVRGPGIRALLLLGAIAVVAVLLDQGSKYLVVTTIPEGDSVPILGSVLDFHFVRNPGAAFSLATGATWIFSIAASVVTLVILVLARRIRSLAWAAVLGMLLGGTVGNLLDRLFREPGFGVGHVIDFIEVAGFPAIFNIADSFIVVSMVLFVILTLRGVGLDGRRLEQAPRGRAARDGASTERDG